MVDLVELRVTWSLVEGGLWRGVIGLVTVRAPVPPIHAGVRIEDYHPPVPVPVRDKDFIRLGINCHIGGLAQMPYIVAVVTRSASSDLEQKFSLVVEFQDLVVAGPVCTASRNPDVVLVVDVYAVLVVFQRPLVPFPRTVPALEQSPSRVELHHDGRWLATRLLFRHACWAMDDPHIVERVGRDTGTRPQNPSLGQLRPTRVHLKVGKLPAGLCVR